MISVTECVSNAIIHGNQQDSKKLVNLELIFEENKIKFIISDQGSGFNVENLADPTAPENLEKTGGRGIFLIKNLADEVLFEEEGKRTVLGFYI
jgi:serine/threonine-protein kinase RsbW